MNQIQDDQDISERLHRLAHRIAQPGADPTADVRRGRARLRRRNALATAGSAVAVIGLAGGVAAVAGNGHDALTPADASGTPTVLASVSTPTPTGTGTCTAATPTTATAPTGATFPSGEHTVLSGVNAMAGAAKTLDDPLKNPTIWHALSSYATILASHLDPTSQHLQTAPTGFTGDPDLPCDPSGHMELGTKLGWKTHGQSGEAMVFVSVTNDWKEDQIHLQFDHWVPTAPPTGAVRAWTATAPGASAVAVRRADGTVVAIDADALFGNDSLTPVAGFGFTTDQLLTTAADPAFTLPR